MGVDAHISTIEEGVPRDVPATRQRWGMAGALRRDARGIAGALWRDAGGVAGALRRLGASCCGGEHCPRRAIDYSGGRKLGALLEGANEAGSRLRVRVC